MSINLLFFALFCSLALASYEDLPWLEVRPIDRRSNPKAQRQFAIVDEWGRELNLRGANIENEERNLPGFRTQRPIDPKHYANGQCPDNFISYQEPPVCQVDAGKGRYVASTHYMGHNDFAQFRELGMNMVRLCLSWSQLESEPGVYDPVYLDRVEQLVDWAEEQGLYVILDLHEDNYSQFIYSDWGVLPVMDLLFPNNGTDGAPPWAVETNGLPSMAFFDLGPLNLAVMMAFNNFYDNIVLPGIPQGEAPGPGIQDHYIGAVAALVKRFKHRSAVAGYEIMNEPIPGYIIDPFFFSAKYLYPFYARVVQAVTNTTENLPICDMRHVQDPDHPTAPTYIPASPWSEQESSPLDTWTLSQNAKKYGRIDYKMLGKKKGRSQKNFRANNQSRFSHGHDEDSVLDNVFVPNYMHFDPKKPFPSSGYTTFGAKRRKNQNSGRNGRPLVGVDCAYPSVGVKDNRHIIFTEPSALRNIVDFSGIDPEPWTTYKNIVHSPHVYTNVFTINKVLPGLNITWWPPSYDFAYESALYEANGMRSAVYVTEYGDGVHKDFLTVEPTLQAADKFLIGGTLWTWKTNCEWGYEACIFIPWAVYQPSVAEYGRSIPQNGPMYQSRKRLQSRALVKGAVGELLHYAYDVNSTSFTATMNVSRTTFEHVYTIAFEEFKIQAILEAMTGESLHGRTDINVKDYKGWGGRGIDFTERYNASPEMQQLGYKYSSIPLNIDVSPASAFEPSLARNFASGGTVSEFFLPNHIASHRKLQILSGSAEIVGEVTWPDASRSVFVRPSAPGVYSVVLRGVAVEDGHGSDLDIAIQEAEDALIEQQLPDAVSQTLLPRSMPSKDQVIPKELRERFQKVQYAVDEHASDASSDVVKNGPLAHPNAKYALQILVDMQAEAATWAKQLDEEKKS